MAYSPAKRTGSRKETRNFARGAGTPARSGAVRMKRSRLAAMAASAAVALLALAGCGSGSSNSGKTSITVWEGFTDVEGTAFHHLVNEFNSSHKNIHVSVLET